MLEKVLAENKHGIQESIQGLINQRVLQELKQVRTSRKATRFRCKNHTALEIAGHKLVICIIFE